MSVLIVGAGFTGSVLSKTLRVTAPELTLTVWEKSRGAGGRQATKRDGEHSCDIGAQYLTHWQSDEFFQPYINVLKSTNVIHELKGNIINAPSKYEGNCVHYVAHKGMNSTSKYFLSGTNVFYGTRVTSLKMLNDQIEVKNSEGRSAKFDAVVFTIPAPQLLEIDMDGKMAPETREDISKVQFTPRFSLMVVFDEAPEYDWVMKYHADDVVRFTVWDNVKRSHGLDPTLLIHCSALYAVKNTDVKTKEEVGQEMLVRLKELFPELPVPKKVIPHFWRYGQVYKPYPGSPGVVTINERPLILAGGDSFMETSNLSMCAKAAEILGDSLKDRFNIPKIPLREVHLK